ncbi:MAG TPA: hypothetical protein VFZ48_01265 [Candidatus Saccharimonadales bacterium]
MKYSTVITLCVAGIILSSIGVGSLLSYRGLEFQVTLTLSLIAALLNLLAIPLFLKGAKQFKAELQRAYIFLCFGIGVFGLAQIQLPLVSLFEWGFWINSGGLAVPYLLGVLGIFYGIRAFAKLLHIKTFWISPVIALIATVALSFAASRLPHVQVAEDELTFQLALALSIWNSVFITFAAITAFLIRTKIGEAYKHSVSWLCAALTVIAFAGWHYAAIQLAMTTGDWYYDYSFTIIPFVVGALILTIAGYKFTTTDAFNTKDTQPKPHTSLELNIILYVASLASRPADIDVTLDTVRLITSRREASDPLPPSDKQALTGVYRKIEEYLVHNDPLRKFSQADLHKNIMEKFELTPQSWTLLWQESETRK